MDPDSTAGASDTLYNDVGEDYISKLLCFDDNCSVELPPSSVAVKTMPNDTMKINHDQVTPEGTSVSKIMNGHSHTSNESFVEDEEHLHHNNVVENGFNLALKLKELMQIKKEAYDLREKFEMIEKEKNELQIQVDFLQVENHQFKHLKDEKEENSQKLDELQKDLANKSKAQVKLRNEIDSCVLQISEKNDAIKKMRRDNKSLWNMVTRFARKLANADLLTAKEKNIMKKYGEENHIPVDSFDCEEQCEEKEHLTLLPENEKYSETNQNKDTIENKDTSAESDIYVPTHCEEENSKVKKNGFQFSQNSTAVLKPRLSSGANYFMKSCRDVIEDPHVSDDCLDVTVNDLKEMRRQLSASKDHFSPISPLPPTPPPTSNKFRQGLSRKCLAIDTPVLTVPVPNNLNETPMASKSQGLLSVDSSVPNSSRKLTFCHQQSEGFEAPSETNAQILRSDAGSIRNNDANVASHTNFLSAPYKFSAKRCHDGTVKLNFHINNPISFTVNPNNWEVSCILGQHDVDVTPCIVEPQSETVNVQACESLNNNLENSVNSRPVMKRIPKIESLSPEFAPQQSSFVSVGKSSILNHDVSLIDNTFGYFPKEKSFHKEMPLHQPHTNMNDNKKLNAFSNLHGNNMNPQQFENIGDDNRSVVSSSCESPSPFRKRNELFSQEFLSPSRNLTSIPSQVKPKTVDNHSNVSKRDSSLVPEVNCHSKYDSSESETELTNNPKPTKGNLTGIAPIKKRRRSNLMASVESSNIIPARNKGRTLLSRAFGSSKNLINTGGSPEVKKLDSNTGKEKISNTVQLNNDKFSSESNSKIGKEIQFNTSSGNNSINCMNLTEQTVEKNENTGVSMQQTDTIYENVKSKKRISRIEIKKSEININDHLIEDKQKKKSDVRKSPKEKAKKEKKAELKRMAALKTRAEEWAAQKMKCDVEENVLLAKEPFDTNSSIFKTVTDNFEKHNGEKSSFPKTENQQEKNPIISKVKLEENENFTNDPVNIPDGYSVKVEDASVKISIDTFLNDPSSDHAVPKKIEEKTNILVPNSSDSCILNNQHEMFNTTEVNIKQNDSKPVLALNQSNRFVDANFPNNHIIQPKIETNISIDSIIKNEKSNEIQNAKLSKETENSSVETKYLSNNEALAFPKPVGNYSLNPENPISNPSHKSPKTSVKVIFLESSSKITSPKESTTKVKSSDSNCFSNINNSDINTSFPEVNLPPLPLDPFRVSGDKNDAFSNKETYVDEKSFESSKNIETITNAKTNLNTLFKHEEIENESFIDFLVKEEIEDSVIKTVSDEKFSSNALVTNDNSMNKSNVSEMKESSASYALSGNAVSKELPSMASCLGTVSNIYSKADITTDTVVADGIAEMKESKVSPKAAVDGIVASKPNSYVPVSDAYSNIDMVIDSVAVGGVEIEIETQDPPPRTCKKRQSSIVDSPPQTDKKRSKGGLESINLSIAKESALSNSDVSNINSQISEADSDNESPLVIAEDIEDIQQSIPISEDENLEESGNFVKKNSPNKITDKRKAKTPKKMGKKIDISNIETAFQALDKIRFTETHFKLHVHTLMTIFINPSIVENTPTLAFYLIKYLHVSRRNPMLSFSLSTDSNILLPSAEKCIVQALLAVAVKNKPHLSGLLPYIIEIMYDLILGKIQYQIYGLSSMCRVFAAICKELDDPSKPRQLCCELLKYRHKFAPFLIASMVGVYRKAFEILPNTTEEEKIFISAISCGVQQKPKTLTEAQWKHCSSIFSKYLSYEFLTNMNEALSFLKSAIEEKCLSDPWENEFMFMGPLVIYAHVNGWNWAKEHLLKNFVIPNLELYSQKEDGERAFSIFTHLCGEICFGAPDEKESRNYLLKFWRLTGEREFVQVHAGGVLLKLILLRSELFPDEMKDWIHHYHEDERVIEASKIYFTRRLMEDHELQFKDNIIS